jgi:hypothetical protein
MGNLPEPKFWQLPLFLTRIDLSSQGGNPPINCSEDPQVQSKTLTALFILLSCEQANEDLDTNTTALMVERSLEPSSDADVVIRTAAEATAGSSLCCDPATEPGKHGNPFCFEGHRCCADGQWACNEGNGSSTCFLGECEEHHPPPNPDLTIKSVWLELPGSLAHVNTVQQGHAYRACFVVANIGSAASGAFRVSGGGLGIPTNPYQDHAGLVPGASRQGCLFYPTTPGPGFYKLGIGADSQHVVNESREDNNDAILPIKVAS